MESLLQKGDRVLVRLEVLDLMALSGQCMVYKGIDRQTGALVAIKQLHQSSGDADQEQIQRFIQEGSLKFGNPHIPDPILCAPEGNNWFLALPYIEGRTLAEYLQLRGGTLPYQETLPIIDQAADALSAIHHAHMIHRDIKPPNIMIQDDGHVWVIDMGITKVLHGAAITQVPGPIGTCPWMSPEQITCDPRMDHRSDLYSLGVLWHWMLTGMSLITGSTFHEIESQILHMPYPAPSTADATIPPYIDVACLRLLAKSPAARFSSAAELRHALAGQPIINGRRFCLLCGRATDAAARYCPHCGADQAPGTLVAVACLACGTSVDHSPSCPGCNRVFSPANHRLRFESGTMAGREFRIPEGIFLTGRAQLSPRDGHISKAHVHIAATNGVIHLQDAGSINKTFVDGQLANAPTRLRPGSQISIAGNLAVYQKN